MVSTLLMIVFAVSVVAIAARVLGHFLQHDRRDGPDGTSDGATNDTESSDGGDGGGGDGGGD